MSILSTTSEACATAYAKLSEIQNLQSAFDSALKEALVSGEFSAVESLSTDLEQKLVALEPIMNRLEVPQKLEAVFNLTEQYNSQVNILKGNGLLETLSSGLEGIKDAEGNEYPIPTIQEIQARFEANFELLLKKKSQGFGQLRLVPFALPISTIVKKIGEAILRHYDPDPTKTKLFSTRQNPDSPTEEPLSLELDTDEPIWQWDEWYKPNSTIYYPKQFDKIHHRGKTKAELLAQNPQNAWNILLLEDTLNIPRENQGKTIGDRPQIEAKKSANDYLEALQTAQTDPTSPFHNEAATTIEDWLMHFLAILEQTDQVIDDWSNPSASSAFQLGTYNTTSTSDNVGNCFWARGNQQANLGRLGPGASGRDYGTRFGVRV